MRCTNCWRQAVEGAAFCNHCGTQLQKICASCDTFNPLDSNFCIRCGLSLPPDLHGTQVSAYQEAQASSPAFSTACLRCHKVNEPGSTYCYSCGLPLDEVEESPQSSLSTVQSQYYTQNQTETQYTGQTYDGQPADFWVRLGAYLLDYIFVFVFLAGLFAIVFIFAEVYPESSLAEYINTYGSDDAPIIEWLDVVGYIVGLLYVAIGIATWSTTIGKRICGLYVVCSDGSKVGFGRAAARYLCYFISFLTIGIGFLMIAFREDKRGLHDLICGTMVVKR